LAEHLRGRVEPDFAEVLLEPRLYRRVESSQTFWTESQRRAQVKLRYLGSLREYDEFAKDVGSSHVFGSTIPCVDLFDQWSVVRRFLIDDDLGLLIKHFTSCPIIRKTISIHLLSETEINLRPGQLVELNGRLAVVVGTDTDAWVPEDHVALWFGEPGAIRVSQNQTGRLRPEVWTVPAEYCTPALEPAGRH
jgi:hypothetical protein